MSEKRYKRFYVSESENQLTIYDNEGLDDYYHLGNDERDVKGICKLLNEQQSTIQFLQDEIVELKKDIDIYKYEEQKHSESARKLYEENERLRNQLERKTILLKIRTKHIDDREKSFHELLNYLESFYYKSNIDGNYAKQDIINILNNWEIREYD